MPPKGTPCVACRSAIDHAGCRVAGARRRVPRRAVPSSSEPRSVRQVRRFGGERPDRGRYGAVPASARRARRIHHRADLDLVTANDTIRMYKPDIVMLELRDQQRPIRGRRASRRFLRPLQPSELRRQDPGRRLASARHRRADHADAGRCFRGARQGLQRRNSGARAHARPGRQARRDGRRLLALCRQPELPHRLFPEAKSHPNGAGYVVLGDAWYSAVGPLLRDASTARRASR